MPTARRQSITLTTAQMVGAVPLAPRVRLPGRHRVQGGPRRRLRQARGHAATEGLRRRAEPRPQGLRRERGAPPLRGPHRGRERHHDRAAARRAPARHARERLGRRARRSSSSRTRCWSTRRASTWRATATGTAARSERSRWTGSARSSGCGATASSTRPTTVPSSSPRAPSASSAARADRGADPASTRRSRGTSSAACGTRPRGSGRVDGGVEMTMEVRGTTEVVSWVLGFGRTAEVLEPAALRDQIPRRGRRFSLTTIRRLRQFFPWRLNAAQGASAA